MITFFTNQNNKRNSITSTKTGIGVYYNGVFFPGWASPEIFFTEAVKPILTACGVKITSAVTGPDEATK